MLTRSRLTLTTLLSTLLLVEISGGTALSADILYEIPNERSKIYLCGTFHEVETTLCENPGDISGFSSRGAPPLVDICNNPTLKDSEVSQIIQTLAARRIDVNTPHRTVGVAALHVAAACGRSQAIELLLESKADINKRDTYGATPLMYASYHRERNNIKLLVERKADIDPTNNYGVSALEYAEIGARDTRATFYLTGDFQTVEPLLAAHIKDDMRGSDSWDSTALINICANYNLKEPEAMKLVQNLVTRGANVNTPHGTAGATALHVAAEQGRPLVVKLLLDRNANIHHRDRWGGTPLMYASSAKHEGNVDVIKLLIRSKANIDDTNYSGQSAAHYAANEGATYNLEVLIKSGANTQLLTLNGTRVFDFFYRAYMQGKITDKRFIDAKNLLANPERELKEEEEREGERKSVMSYICAALYWKWPHMTGTAKS